MGLYPLADTGGCGPEYGEFIFSANQHWTYAVYTEGSPDCAGVTLWGTYTANQDVMSLYVTGTDCGECSVDYTIPEYFQLQGSNTLELCDYPSGLNCVDEYRQS